MAKRLFSEVPVAIDNRNLFASLHGAGHLEVQRGALFEQAPGPLTLEQEQLLDKLEGMMLGLAIGDALGNTSESLSPSQRLARYGEIRDYLPNRHHNHEPIGLPSDDSQLAFWTLSHLLEHGGLVPEALAERFCRGPIFGIGATVREFVANHKRGLPWYQCGPASAGNGALMRIAPVLIPHLPEPSSGLWADAALAAALTHNDSASTAACVAFVAMFWQLLGRLSLPEAAWWLERYLEVGSTLETGKRYRPRGGAYLGYDGPAYRYVEQVVSEAEQQGLDVLDACERWRSGAYLLETIPSALYILMRYGHDPEEAIVRAVNDTKDNDTIAAIVGAAVGALHGRKALPARWIEGLLGRTAEQDDGAVFALLMQMQAKWWSPAS